MELTQEALTQAAEAFLKDPGRNQVTAEEAISAEAAGLPLWDMPLFGISSARDPLYEELKKPEVIGPWFLPPEAWLPEARSVLSFFLPFSQPVRQSNRADARLPSAEWLHGRYEGQALLFGLCRHLAAALEADGWKAVVPSLDPRFATVETPGTHPAFPPDAADTSNWSERHAAYISGLGTFGLSKGLITQRGICGRFGSLVTDAPFPVTPRPYTGLYDYCTRCGACVRRCPVEAISLERGKLHPPCRDYVAWTEREYAPRYGCGKCQVAVPCASKRPKPRKAAPS